MNLKRLLIQSYTLTYERYQSSYHFTPFYLYTKRIAGKVWKTARDVWRCLMKLLEKF